MKPLFLFISLFYVQLNSFAQQKTKECYPIYVNHHDYTVKTNVFSKNKKVKANIDLTYYWYSSNKIQETMGGYDGKILHGQYASFYLNGNLKEKGAFKMGLKSGDWTSWYENGKIKDVTSWKKGHKEHTSYNYNADGEIISKSSYRNNKLNGMVYNYKNGLISEKKRYKNGIEIIEKEKKIKEIKEPKDESKRFSTMLKNIGINVENKLKKKAKNKEEVAAETNKEKKNRKVKKDTEPKLNKKQRDDKQKTNKEKTDTPPVVSKKTKKVHTVNK